MYFLVFKPNLKKFQEPLLRLIDFQRFLFLVVHHLTIFDHLIQKGFSSFSKKNGSNLHNPFHDVIIIPFSVF